MLKPRLRRRAAPVAFRVGAFELTKQGASRWDLRDPYHIAVTLRWPAFFLAVLLVELALNLVFATIYRLAPGSVLNAASFLDDFFFSIETLATVGYGVMAPGTLFGQIVATVEILCGLTFTALMTGLIFVRFSRPRAKILFAEKLVVSTELGYPALMLRIANGRMTLLADATARLHLMLLVRGSRNQLNRRIIELPLQATTIPFFALTWTLIHPINAESPLAGLDLAGLAAVDARFFATIEARDISLNAVVHAMQDFSSADLLYGMRYQDAVTIFEGGGANADLTKLSAVEPAGAGWINLPDGRG